MKDVTLMKNQSYGTLTDAQSRLQNCVGSDRSLMRSVDIAISRVSKNFGPYYPTYQTVCTTLLVGPYLLS